MDVRPTELLEPDDLLRRPDGDHYELIDGVPVEKHMGAESDEIAVGLGALLLRYVREKGLGRVYGSQTPTAWDLQIAKLHLSAFCFPNFCFSPPPRTELGHSECR